MENENVVMTKEQLAEFGKTIFNEQIKELGLDKIDVKHAINPLEDEAKQKALDPKYRMGQFAKAVLSRSVDAITKAVDPNNETTTTEGGYLVPDVTRNEILRIAESYGQVRPFCRVIPMGKSKVIYVPTENGGVTTYWVSEEGDITSSKVTFSRVTLTAKKNGCIVPFTNELDEDSIIDWGGYVNYLVGKAFAKEEDSQFAVGTGSPIVGIFSTTHTFGKKVEVVDPASLTYNDFVDMIYGIDPGKVVGGKMFMHRTILGVAKKLVDLTGVPLFQPANSGQPSTIMGIPLVLFEYAPASTANTAGLPLIVYGDLNNAIIGTKKEITALYSNTATLDSTSMYQNDTAAIRFIRRLSFVFAMPSECATIKIAE